MHRMTWWLFVLALLACARICNADVIVGNFGASSSPGTSFDNTGGSKGLGFTMASTHMLEAVDIQLDISSSQLATTQLAVHIYDNNASNRPGTSLVVLDPAEPLTSGTQTYRFLPPSPFILAEAESYWIVVIRNGSGVFNWLSNMPSIEPSGPGAAHLGSVIGSSPPPSTISSTLNTYAVHSTVRTVAFDSQGGSTVAPIMQEPGTAVTLPANPSRDGYTFAGWNTVANGLGTSHGSVGETFSMPPNGISLYAQWSIQSYAVTATVLGGHGQIAPASQSVEYGSVASFAITPDPGYRVAELIGGDCLVGTLADNSYETGAVDAACEVIVSFEQYPSAPTAVPVISPWMLSVLALLLGVVGVRQRISRRPA